MDKKLKTKWVKALRSGRYKQGRKAIHPAKNEYCCLGVLCRVVNKRVKVECLDASNEKLYAFIDSLLNIPSSSTVRNTRLELATRNDGSRDWENDAQSFEQIADYIESNL